MRMESKEWLTELLTDVAKLCYQDLQAMVTRGDKCFPPEYKIVPFFVRRYHAGLVRVVRMGGMRRRGRGGGRRERGRGRGGL